MATRLLSGGPITGAVTTFAPDPDWTDPTPGDLVKHATGSYQVAECVATDVPIGVILQVSDDASVLTVELFSSGAIARLPYTGDAAIGQQIQASDSNTVTGVDSGGTGTIIAGDLVSNTVDVLFL